MNRPFPQDQRRKAPQGLPLDLGDDDFDSFDPTNGLPADTQQDDDLAAAPGFQSSGRPNTPDGTEDTPDSMGNSLTRSDGSMGQGSGGRGFDDAQIPSGNMDNTLTGEDQGLTRGNLNDPKTRAAIGALYGDDCPLLMSNPSPADWVAWTQHLWNALGPGQQAAVHLVERNRLFRKNMQWISAIGFGPWREPMKSQDEARIVENMIAPALDQRVEIVSEQRPGFLCEPEQIDQDAKKKSDAMQSALDYQWDQQNMRAFSRESAYWSGTDGVTFGETYWDVNAGPWQSLPRYENPEADQPPSWSSPMPLGDVRTRNLRIEQVRVSTEATMTRKPWLWCVREIMPKSQAVRQYGTRVANEIGTYTYDDNLQHVPAAQMGFVLPELDEIMRQQEVVACMRVYAEKSEFLPFAMQLVIVGDQLVVPPMPIPIGRVPIFPWRDGTTDPSFYPLPEMHWWINCQIRYNALWSKLIQGIRKHAGINLLARENTISGETMIAGGMNLWSVKGGGTSLNDVVKEIGGQPVSPDVGAALAQTKAMFERMTGWNDTTNGSFTPDTSGRAILAMREQVERIFARMVSNASEAMCDWAKLTLAWMRWGYDIPRAIRVTGKSRPDLGRLIVQSTDFEDVAQVNLDPETLMPMPRALRLAMLDDMLQKQVMDPKEYRRRLPIAYVGQLSSPDEDDEARANRIAEMIKQTGNPMPLPILWQDNEAIHQDVLERQVIKNDDLQPNIRLAAHQRWEMLAQQSQMKSMGMIAPPPGAPELGAPPAQPPGPEQQQGPPPQGGPPQGGPPPGPGGKPPGPANNPGQTGLTGPARFLGASQAPTQAMNGPIAAMPSPIDQTRVTNQFERTAAIR